MTDLKLVLKKKWFDMIASGEKKEEYRDVTPYWKQRLLTCYKKGCNDAKFCVICLILPKKFDTVTFYLGYAKDRPKMTFKFEFVYINTGNPEWGAEPCKDYFVIKLGERLS